MKGKAKILAAKRITGQSEIQKMRQAWLNHLSTVEKRFIGKAEEDHSAEIQADMAPYRNQALQLLS